MRKNGEKSEIIEKNFKLKLKYCVFEEMWKIDEKNILIKRKKCC